MKRKKVHLRAEDPYGHWWFEMGQESYGWWPKTQVNLKQTFLGTSGELNGQSNFPGGSATQDPHHGGPADEEFHPMTSAGDCRSDVSIQNCLRSFAQSYSGEWRWTFGLGQNCHTFQEAAMKHCGLKKP